MLPIAAFVLVLGASMLGPLLVGSQADCSSSSNSNREDRSVSKCEVDRAAREMRKRKMPKELKVEAEGKLYSIPDGVKMVGPSSEGKMGKWWKRLSRKKRDAAGDGDEGGSTEPANPPTPFEETMKRGADGGDDGAPGSQSGGDDVGGEGTAARKDFAWERACQICFDQNYSTVMLPCGHGGLCWECGLHIYALTEECPMCRTQIELLVPLDNKNKRYEGGCEFVSSSTAFGRVGKSL